MSPWLVSTELILCSRSIPSWCASLQAMCDMHCATHNITYGNVQSAAYMSHGPSNSHARFKTKSASTASSVVPAVRNLVSRRAATGGRLSMLGSLMRVRIRCACERAGRCVCGQRRMGRELRLRTRRMCHGKAACFGSAVDPRLGVPLEYHIAPWSPHVVPLEYPCLSCVACAA